MANKKLIEVSLPLEAINAESAREKSIRHGHPSTLHLWWARRPLASARAVLWASLVDDPSSHPEQFPNEKEQAEERARLHALLSKLVKWENSGNEALLAQARAEIEKSLPPHHQHIEDIEFLDPFSGGGSIPLEAQRLGLKVHAHDLNPVAVMINKAMIEIPPRFADLPPVHPDTRKGFGRDPEWKGAKGLAEDVSRYGQWMKEEAFRRIGHLYPKEQIPTEFDGKATTVMAWKWVRTVKCPNPACGCEIPLATSFVLSKKKGHEAWSEPYFTGGKLSFKVHSGGKPSIAGTVNRKGAVCPCCKTVVPFDYIRDQGKASKMQAKMMAVVAEGARSRIYLSPNVSQIHAAQCSAPENCPETSLPTQALGFRVQVYGIDSHKKLFTPRQLIALTTFSDLVAEVQEKATQDALAAGMKDDVTGLAEGGQGAMAYGQAIGVYLAFVVDKLADYHSTICVWNAPCEKIEHTFSRQAIPMVWDYMEGNPFSSSSGCFDNMLVWVIKCLKDLPASGNGIACQQDAQTDCGLRNVVISTDPPYYDNIGYADLADYFYIWLRRSLRKTYPRLFRTMLVPKAEELVATPYRFDGDKRKARNFFENGMYKTCCQIHAYAKDDVPVTLYYAYKQNDNDINGQVSTGWETMLSAVIRSGFVITGTWPLHTERETGLKAAVNALASSIVLVCRKRPQNAPSCTRRSFLGELRRELHPALRKLQESNIAPVDMAQAAIGPGMAVYSRYKEVLEPDGSVMTIRAALQIINAELDVHFAEQDGDLDEESRFCVALYSQTAFNDIAFGEADVLARAKNTSVDRMADLGLLEAQRGNVCLKVREKLPDFAPDSARILWLLAQQLTRAMNGGGGIEECALMVASIPGSLPGRARDLAYRLFSLAERKGWAQEACAYNNLVISWPEIQQKALDLRNSVQLKTGSLV